MLALNIFTGIFFLVLVSLFGMVVYGKIATKQRKEAYTDVEKRELSDVDPSQMDYAYVSGEVTDTDGFLTAPFSQKECVAYRAEIQRWEFPPGEHNAEPKQWIPDTVVSKSSQFLLEDEFSSVAVDGSEATIDWAVNREHVSESGVEPPEPYNEFVKAYDHYTFDDEGVAKAHKVRFVERRIDLRDTVHVAGGIEQASGKFSSANAIINKKLDKDDVRHPFIISDSEIDVDKMEDLV
jgi:hypothetical protein